jgi:hypothetical protein
MSLLQKSQAIKEAASIFLAKKEIVTILSSYGEVFFTGSYKTDLMVWPDIDIQIILPEKAYKIEVFTKIAKDFLSDPDLNKLQIINFTAGKKPGMPLGLYLGLDYQDSDIKWKLDLWSLEKEFFEQDRLFTEKIIANMTLARKELIITIKNQLIFEGRVPQSASYYLYKGIFEEKLTDEKEILAFIKSFTREKT